MQKLITGQRLKLQQIQIEDLVQIDVQMKMAGCDIDICCFGVDEKQNLSDDRYFIFYNQLTSPENAIIKEMDRDSFTIDLQKLPLFISKLIITAAIDGDKNMSQLGESTLSFITHRETRAFYSFSGNDFQQEKAIILTEIYRKGTIWSLSIIGKGFNGGLSALLKAYGGEETEEDSKKQLQEKPKKVDLTKAEKIQKIVLTKAPHLVDLTKKAVVSLEKKNLMDVAAQVVLVLDVSGSMYHQYKNGRIQRLLDKTLPLALLFDADGKLDSWAFATNYRQLPTVTLENIKDFILLADGGWKNWDIGGSNNEPKVMEEIYLKYKNNKTPVYIIFVSDGGVSQNRKIKDILKAASYAPIFWQFMGIGGKNYGILEKLDEMQGRYIDNANFFALDDIDVISDEALYDRMMNEFPSWLQLAKQKNIL